MSSTGSGSSTKKNKSTNNKETTQDGDDMAMSILETIMGQNLWKVNPSWVTSWKDDDDDNKNKNNDDNDDNDNKNNDDDDKNNNNKSKEDKTSTNNKNVMKDTDIVTNKDEMPFTTIPLCQALDETEFVGLFFGAQWSSISNQFLNPLIDFYHQINHYKDNNNNNNNNNLESKSKTNSNNQNNNNNKNKKKNKKNTKLLDIVYVSSDETMKQLHQHFSIVPSSWYTIQVSTFTQSKSKNDLVTLFKAYNIPALVILHVPTGQFVTEKGRNHVLDSITTTTTLAKAQAEKAAAQVVMTTTKQQMLVQEQPQKEQKEETTTKDDDDKGESISTNHQTMEINNNNNISKLSTTTSSSSSCSQAIQDILEQWYDTSKYTSIQNAHYLIDYGGGPLSFIFFILNRQWLTILLIGLILTTPLISILYEKPYFVIGMWFVIRRLLTPTGERNIPSALIIENKTNNTNDDDDKDDNNKDNNKNNNDKTTNKKDRDVKSKKTQ